MLCNDAEALLLEFIIVMAPLVLVILMVEDIYYLFYRKNILLSIIPN